MAGSAGQTPSLHKRSSPQCRSPQGVLDFIQFGTLDNRFNFFSCFFQRSFNRSTALVLLNTRLATAMPAGATTRQMSAKRHFYNGFRGLKIWRRSKKRRSSLFPLTSRTRFSPAHHSILRELTKLGCRNGAATRAECNGGAVRARGVFWGNPLWPIRLPLPLNLNAAGCRSLPGERIQCVRANRKIDQPGTQALSFC